MEIKIPNLEFAKVVRFCVDYKNFSDVDEELIFDFGEITHCDPFAMLLISSAIDNIKQNSKSIISAINVESTFASYMNFFKRNRLPIGNAVNSHSGGENSIPISRLTRLEILNRCRENYTTQLEEIEKISINISKKIGRGNSSLEETMSYIIREITRNTFEHSEADSIEFCAQYWPGRKRIVIGFIDKGIGIKNSLSSNLNYKLDVKSDEDALRMAILPGVSKSFSNYISDEYFDDISSNSGYGLFMASRIAAKFDGNFSILSGEKCLNFTYSQLSENYNIETLDAYHHGTGVRMEFSTNQLNLFGKYMNEIIVEGKSPGLNNVASFKEPSKSSASKSIVNIVSIPKK